MNIILPHTHAVNIILREACHVIEPHTTFTFLEYDTAVLEGVLFLDTGLFLVITARHTHTHTHAQRLRLSIYYEPAAAPVSVEHMHI